jgi:D-3-phosphoglycerate dehydrogenase
MEKWKIAITIRSFNYNNPSMAALDPSCDVIYKNKSGHHLSEEDLIRALTGVQGAIAGTEGFSRRVLEKSTDLRIISRVGVGIDSIDTETAKRLGIRILTTRQAPAQAVAEHTLALLLAVAKKIVASNDAMRRGDFAVRPGLLIQGRRAGIVGLGQIGSRVARLLQAFGSPIAFHDPAPATPPEEGWKQVESLADLVAGVEILSLHAPALPGGRPLLTAPILDHCKPGMILVNTARGSLIDEKALLRAIEDGRVAGAGLDVFSTEPYTGPLLSCPAVVATPHVASNTIESRELMEAEAMTNLLHALGEGVR